MRSTSLNAIQTPPKTSQSGPVLLRRLPCGTTGTSVHGARTLASKRNPTRGWKPTLKPAPACTKLQVSPGTTFWSLDSEVRPP